MNNIEKQETAPQMPSLEDKLVRPMCLDYRNASDNQKCKSNYIKEFGEVQNLLVFTHDPEISRRVFRMVSNFALDGNYPDSKLLISLMNIDNLFCDDEVLKESMKGIADSKGKDEKKKYYITKLFNSKNIDNEERETVMAKILSDWINSGEYFLKRGSNTVIIQAFLEDIELNTSLEFVEEFKERIREVYRGFRNLHLSRKDIGGSNMIKVLNSINMLEMKINKG